ncbi:MAG TPA: DNA (cytosine-5-)-methyltransferase [Candidatus Atribacteria bacterium]|nr:DNA (cytosine-5-)-methyltransferase [Candidatus Atribacteria bacterium]
MKETKKIYSCIDLFAGAGGFGLGFSLAGFKIICSIEKDKWAADTLRENGYSEIVVEGDIRKISNADQLEIVGNNMPDVIIGGPPCQGFSNASPVRNRDPNDPRNSLFVEFAEWVKNLHPKVFVIENVKGILSRRNKDDIKVIEIIEKTFSRLGYKIEIWNLNAANYGVPQSRERVFIIGHRKRYSFNPPPITHLFANKNNGNKYQDDNLFLSPAICVHDAISDLPYLEAGEGMEEQEYIVAPQNIFQVWARGTHKTVFNHVAMNHTKRVVERFKQIQIGTPLVDLPVEFKVRKRSGNGVLSDIEYRLNDRHLKPHEISNTIPASFYSSFIHPYQPRNITAREAARIQSFPDHYRFMGKRTTVSNNLLNKYDRKEDNYLSQYYQIGNAVPPLLAKAIACQIAHYLDD